MASSSSARAKRPRRATAQYQHRDEETESEHESLAAMAFEAPRRARINQSNIPPPLRPQCTHVSFFGSQHKLDDFLIKVGTRDVMKERKFCENFLRENNWPYLDDLIAWGWWDFMNWHNLVYENLVRTFYYNGDRRQYDNGVPLEKTKCTNAFVTSVLGNRIVVNKDLIAQFLTNPRCNEHDETYDLDLVQATRLVYRNENLMAFVDKVIPLGFNNRMLHLLLCNTIKPREGTQSVISQEEMVIMARIILRKPPNLCEIIAERMVKAVVSARSSKSEADLPYGRLVSQICVHYCPNRGGEIYGGKEKTIVNAAAVRAMGFEKRDGVFVWTGHKQNRRTNLVIEDPQEQAQEEVAEEGVGAMDLNALTVQIQQMHWQHMEQVYLQREEQSQRHEATIQWQEEQNQWRDVSNQRDMYFYDQLQDMRSLQSLPPFSRPFPTYPPPPPPEL